MNDLAFEQEPYGVSINAGVARVLHLPRMLALVTLVQTDLNSGSNNWIDSNWVATNQVGQHTISIDQMMRWAARRPKLGFQIYRLQ